MAVEYSVLVAGIPVSHFDAFLAQKDVIVEGDSEQLSGKPINDGETLGPRYAARFLRELADEISSDHHGKLSHRKTFMLVVGKDEDVESFTAEFFPFLPVTRLEWIPSGTSKKTIRASVRGLALIARKAIQIARENLKALSREIKEQDNKTFLLLPSRNFRSKNLVPILKVISENVARSEISMKAAKNGFFRYHPLRSSDSTPMKFFYDDRDFQFRPPGADRHGFARLSYEGHPLRCFLASRLRMGVFFDAAFHFDCQVEKGQIAGNFFGCHDSPSHFEAAYLNIAPNDYVRR